MEIVITIIVVVVLAGLVATGVGIGRAGSPPTISLPPADTPSAADCAQACAAWDNARQMECNAKADETAARNRADALRGQMLASIAAAVALSAAGVAALVGATAATATLFGIPLGIYLMGIAVGLFVAAAVAAAAAALFAGQLIAAEQDATSKSAARSAWATTVANARNQVNSKCPLAEANACLSRSAPC